MSERRRQSVPETRAPGFTLIELLVVIAIIALIAAILFPVFASAREKARQTTCLSNEKQMGLAIMQYTQDFDEMLPIVVSQSTNAGLVASTGIGQVYNQQSHWGWIEEIFPYVKANAQVFCCPSDPERSGATNAQGSSYGMNTFLGWTPSHDPNTNANTPGMCQSSLLQGTLGWCGDKPYSLAQLATPADKILVAEFGQISLGSKPVYQRQCYSEIPYPHNPGSANYVGQDYLVSVASNYNITANHNGMGNFIFCDGHAKATPSSGNSLTLSSCLDQWIPQDDYTGSGGTCGTIVRAWPHAWMGDQP